MLYCYKNETPMIKKLAFVLALAAGLAASVAAHAEIKVMASIKPVHSLVASVMKGVGEPGLIVSGSNSPHTYALKPSDAQALEHAQVIFWIGHNLEGFLEKPIASLGGSARVVSLIDVKGVKTLPVREGSGFDRDEDGGHGSDGHIWLDPENAKAMVNAIAEALSAADPEHAVLYRANAEKTVSRLDALSDEVAGKVSAAKGKGFIVFHDAYHYFEKAFGVKAVGAISINPENAPSAQGIIALKQRIIDGKADCVFSEPQFDQKLVSVIMEGTQARSGALDPLGANAVPGPDLYFNMIESLATSLADCLDQH